MYISSWAGRGNQLVSKLDKCLTPERLKVYPTATLVLFVLAVAWTWWARGVRPLPDFASRWTAGRLLVNGQASALYEPSAQAAIQQNILGGSSLSLFVSPPHVALLFTPLGALPYTVACAIWATVTVGCIWLSIAILGRLGRVDSPLQRRITVLPILASYPMLELVGAGQDSGLVLLALSAGMWLLHSRRDVLAGPALAIGLVKPHLIFLVPLVLLCQSRYRALLAFSISAGALAATCLWVSGWAGCARWLALLLGNEYADVVQRGQAWKSASLPGTVNALLPVSASRLWDLIGLALALVVIGISIAVFRRRHEATLTVWGFAAAAMCLTSPHTMVYDLVLVVPALFSMAEVAWGPIARAMLTVWSLALFLVAPVHGLVGAASWPFSILSAPWHVIFLVWIWHTLSRTGSDGGSHSTEG